MIASYPLPGDTRARLRDRLALVERFPFSGQDLTGRWAGRPGRGGQPPQIPRAGPSRADRLREGRSRGGRVAPGRSGSRRRQPVQDVAGPDLDLGEPRVYNLLSRTARPGRLLGIARAMSVASTGSSHAVRTSTAAVARIGSSSSGSKLEAQVGIAARRGGHWP